MDARREEEGACSASEKGRRPPTSGGCASPEFTANLITALIVLLLVVVIVALWRRPGGASCAPTPRSHMLAHPDSVALGDQRPTVFRELSRLYSTADVDPLVTGQLYAGRDETRNIYGSRTSHGGKYGLQEFSSSGLPGDVGVDQGPYGLAEYGGRVIGYDDGIPEPWVLPSTPTRWYRPRQRDYYGPEGPTPYTVGLYSLTEPDHEVYMP